MTKPIHESSKHFTADYQACCPIVELRQYTSSRKEDLFDRKNSSKTQEALGINVIGQFRDLGDWAVCLAQRLS